MRARSKHVCVAVAVTVAMAGNYLNAPPMRACASVHTRIDPRCVRAALALAAGEYVDDTEDLINIQLDFSRNKLIRFEIMLTTGTFAFAFFNMVAGAWLAGWLAGCAACRCACACAGCRAVPRCAALRCAAPRRAALRRAVPCCMTCWAVKPLTDPGTTPSSIPNRLSGMLGENLVLPEAITQVRACVWGWGRGGACAVGGC